MSKKKCTFTRLGASTLAAAVVVAGLGFGPAAIATPAADNSFPQTMAIPSADQTTNVAAPTVNSAYKYTDASGATKLSYTITGVAGATMQFRFTTGDERLWYSRGTIGAAGTGQSNNEFDPTRKGVEVRLVLNGQNSDNVVVNAADVKDQLPAPTVNSAYKYTDANGDTKYAYTVTGIPGMKVEHGAANAAWQPLGTLDNTGTTTFSGKSGSDTKNWDFRVTNADGTIRSPKTTITPAEVKNQLPAPTVTGAYKYTDADGKTMYSYTVTGAPGASAQLSWDGAGWGSSTIGLIGESGTSTFFTDRGAATGTIWARQGIGSQFSPSYKFDAAVIEQSKIDAGAGTAASVKVGKSASVEAMFKASGQINGATGTVEFTAPAGTTFADAQDTIRGAYQKPGEDWTSASMTLTDGQRSADGTKYTYKFANANTWVLPANSLMRWNITVAAASDAAPGAQTMSTTFSGAVTQGGFAASSSTPVTIEGSSIVDPTGSVSFDADVTKRATVSGTGAAGATITLYKGQTVVGTAPVGTNGQWSTQIAPLGAGSHTIRIAQTGIEGTQEATTTADYGSAVTLTAPATFTEGAMTVTGQSSQGAKVEIVTGGKTVDEFTVTNADGSFSRDLTDVGSGKIALTATADSKGAVTTTASAESTAPITAESVAMASHVKDGTFEPGLVTFAGRSTVGTTVTLNPFGFDDKYAAYNLTTTTDQWGEWTIQRNLSNTPYLLLSFKQTAQAGVTNQVTNYGLKPFQEIGAPGDLQLTNFKAGDFFNPGDQVFSGKATPGATVTLNPFGFDPKYTQYDITTIADAKTGNWEIRRGLAANTLYRELAVKQDPEEPGKVNKIEHITVAAYGWVGSAADLTVTSHADKTFTPGTEQTFTGTATAGTTVTLYPFGTDYESHKMTTLVDATGKWTIKRTLGNQVFPMVFTQTEQDGKVNTVDVRMTPTK
ncbi:hypothetical protein ACO0E1_05860 [Curtobacterium sp. RRHDQ66]|uniref:hypothetical protein n=1 Tax=Curtobacterium guangdongense TaxID=3413380 RepID=UPI003BEFD443